MEQRLERRNTARVDVVSDFILGELTPLEGWMETTASACVTVKQGNSDKCESVHALFGEFVVRCTLMYCS